MQFYVAVPCFSLVSVIYSRKGEYNAAIYYSVHYFLRHNNYGDENFIHAFQLPDCVFILTAYWSQIAGACYLARYIMAIMVPFLLQWCHLPSEITKLEYAGLSCWSLLYIVLVSVVYKVWQGMKHLSYYVQCWVLVLFIVEF